MLRECFDGLITLTDLTGTRKSEQQAADIVVHYVPRAGGVVFGGYAICGDHGCPNILVRCDLPPSLDREPYDPEYLGWVTLHEIGHALGLGHATNLEESTDLMGSGWTNLGDPVLSDCDVDAIAFVFAWALEAATHIRPRRAGRLLAELRGPSTEDHRRRARARRRRSVPARRPAAAPRSAPHSPPVSTVRSDTARS